MVYLLNMVIFHSKLLVYQRVIPLTQHWPSMESAISKSFQPPPALKRSRLGSRKKEPSVYHAVPVLVALRYQHESTMISWGYMMAIAIIQATRIRLLTWYSTPLYFCMMFHDLFPWYMSWYVMLIMGHFRGITHLVLSETPESSGLTHFWVRLWT